MAKKKKNILKTVATIAIGVFAAPIAGAIGLSGAIGGVVGATAGRVIGGALVGAGLGAATGTGAVAGAVGGALGGWGQGAGGANSIPGTGLKIGGINPVTSTTGAAVKAGVQYAPSVSSGLASNVVKAGLTGNVPVVAQGTPIAAGSTAVAGKTVGQITNVGTPAVTGGTNSVAGLKAVPDSTLATTSIPKQVTAPVTNGAKAADIQAAQAGPQSLQAPPAKEVVGNASGAVKPAGTVNTTPNAPMTATPAQVAAKPQEVLLPNYSQQAAAKIQQTQSAQQAPQFSPRPGLQNAPQVAQGAPQKPQQKVSNSSGISGALQRVGGTIASNFMTPEGAMALTQMALGMSATPPGLEEVVAQRQQELADAQANDVESYNRIRGIAYSMLDDINRWDPRRMALQRATTEGVRANRASREAKRRAKAKGYFGGEVADTDRQTTLQTSRNVGEAYNEGWKDFQTAKFDAQGRVAGLLGTRSPTTPTGDLEQVTGFTTDMWTNEQAAQARGIGGLINVAFQRRDPWEDQQLAGLNEDKNKWGNG